MSKNKKIKEYLRKLVVRELNEQGDEGDKKTNNVPSHFGGGENISVFGYQTENFDICRSAVNLFQKLEKVLNAQSENQESFQKHKKHTIMAAEYMDKLLGIERQVVKAQKASTEQLNTALDLLNLFNYKIGVLGGRLEIDFSKEISFSGMHYDEIQKRHNGNVEEVSTTASAGIDGTGTGHYDTPFAFSGKGKKNRRKKIAKQSGYKPVNEITNKEISALQKLQNGLKKLQQDYIKITNVGDKTLKNTQYNDYYEYIIGAKEGIGKLIQTLKSKQMLGEDSLNWEKNFPGFNKQEYRVIQRLIAMNSKHIDGEIRQYKKNPKAYKRMIKKFLKRFPRLRRESINEGKYHQWRNDESLTPKQKIGRSMREIRDALNELDKTVKMNLKLKTELNMKSEDYWKNTHKALTKISERLVKMANKIGNLK